jgi:hypothetical protein
MSFDEMDLETLWANEPDHDWMVGDCPDKKCSEWYALHQKWLNALKRKTDYLFCTKGEEGSK